MTANLPTIPRSPPAARGMYVDALAVAPRGAWPLGLGDVYPAEYAASCGIRAPRRDNGRLAAISTCMSMSAGRLTPNSAKKSVLRRHIARLSADVRHVAVGMPRRCRRPGAYWRASAAAADPMSPPREPAAQRLHRRGRELLRLRRTGPRRRLLPVGRPDRREGNVNLVSVGDYARPTTRFPARSLSLLYYVSPKVILFRARAFQAHAGAEVDFIKRGRGSARMSIGPARDRAHHQPLPVRLRPRAPSASRWKAVPPATRSRKVIANTGSTRPPSGSRRHRLVGATLAILREVVAPQIAEVYPKFAASVFGIAQRQAG